MLSPRQSLVPDTVSLRPYATSSTAAREIFRVGAASELPKAFVRLLVQTP